MINTFDSINFVTDEFLIVLWQSFINLTKCLVSVTNDFSLLVVSSYRKLIMKYEYDNLHLFANVLNLTLVKFIVTQGFI